MNTSNFAQTATFAAGLFYLAVALTMFVAPRWFFENAGHFPPFNRHYMGDVASFLLPLAIGLLVAARDLRRYRLIIGIAAAASVIHTANHAYDAIFNQITHGHWLVDFTPLILLAAALLFAYYRPQTDRRSMPESEFSS
jgi:hypothetical protein